MAWQDAYARYRERIDAHVAAAPPLTAEQLARLAVLLNNQALQAAVPGPHAGGSSHDSSLGEKNHDHDTACE